MKANHLESERFLQGMKYLIKNAHVRNVDNQTIAVPTADISAKILAKTVDFVHVLTTTVSTPQNIAGTVGITTTRS